MSQRGYLDSRTGAISYSLAGMPQQVAPPSGFHHHPVFYPYPPGYDVPPPVFYPPGYDVPPPVFYPLGYDASKDPYSLAMEYFTRSEPLFLLQDNHEIKPIFAISSLPPTYVQSSNAFYSKTDVINPITFNILFVPPNVDSIRILQRDIINRMFQDLVSENIDDSTKFIENLQTREPSLNPVLQHSVVHSNILNGFDLSINPKDNYITQFTRFVENYNTIPKLLIVDYEQFPNLLEKIDFIPFIYIIKMAIKYGCAKVIIVCKKQASNDILINYFNELQTRNYIIEDLTRVDCSDIKEFVNNNLIIIKITSLCNLFCHKLSSHSSQPSTSVGASAAGTSAAGTSAVGTSAGAHISGIRYKEISPLIPYINKCNETFLHRLRGCDDSIIVILYSLFKSVNPNINILILSNDRFLFSDFVNNQSFNIPFSVDVMDQTFSFTSIVNLARDPYNISNCADHDVTLLFSNPQTVQEILDTSAQGGFPQVGFPQGGFAQGGFAQVGFPQGGFAQGGFAQGGFAQGGSSNYRDKYLKYKEKYLLLQRRLFYKKL